jgi:putative peptidoglycan lipid II flippase
MNQFSALVNNAVYRTTALSLIVSAWMMAAALPIVDLVYRRGRFHFGDSQETAIFFFWFSLSLALWSAQGLYARAFYAAGDTLTPMVAGTVVTLASLPVYAWFFHRWLATGLTIASDLGIFAHTVVVVTLLHRKRLVPLSDLPWREFAKALIVAGAAGWIAYLVGRAVVLDGSRRADFESLGLISLTWAGAVAGGLWITRSSLLRDLRRRPS